MSFSKQYAALEVKFKDQVEKDNNDFEGFGIKSCFLANVAPKAPVDYVLVAMEPSLPANIDDIKNFAVSIEDFILHFCANEYLCKRERTYHITDLSKGAMLVSDASISPALRYKRYKRWYPLLCEEIELMAGPDVVVIAIGTPVERFLMKQQFPGQLAGRILHYSWSASPYRPKMKRCYPDRYAKFKDTVGLSDVEKTVKRVMTETEFGSCEPEKTLHRLKSGKGLTESRRQLMFTYKCQFEKILEAAAQSP